MQHRHNGSLKWQRYEAKYLVTERQAAEIRRYCGDHLPPDPHAARRPGNEYPVISLYLDSPWRLLLRHTLEKQVQRYKLRVRTYRRRHEPWAERPAFVEVKRRLNGVVQKTRARVGPEAVEPVLWTECALFDGRGVYDPVTEQNVNEFLQLRNRIGAVPAVGTFYMREAYEGISAERIRITLDRNLHYGVLAPSRAGPRETWWPTNAGGVILEVKFTNTYPFWVANMLRRLEVLRRGVCKYVICSRAAGVSAECRSLPKLPLIPGLGQPAPPAPKAARVPSGIPCWPGPLGGDTSRSPRSGRQVNR